MSMHEAQHENLQRTTFFGLDINVCRHTSAQMYQQIQNAGKLSLAFSFCFSFTFTKLSWYFFFKNKSDVIQR